MLAIRKTVITALSCAALLALLAGCEKPGPAERAGKEIDNAVKKVTQQVAWDFRDPRGPVSESAR